MERLLYNLATDKYRGFLPGCAKGFLWVLSGIYGAAVLALAWSGRLRQVRFTSRVISVGNVTVGGTGKTTLVRFLAGHLKQQGHRVAIVTRGYRRLAGSMGDEPQMLAQNLTLPVIVNPDRARGIRRAQEKEGADTVILDDGFQQWKIRKDLDIVAIDATNPFGNRRLLPRGIMREPFSSLARADIFVLTKGNLASDTQGLKGVLHSINPKAVIVEGAHTPVGFYALDRPGELLPVDACKGKRVGVFSGIGDPVSFEQLLAGLGAAIGFTLRFPDHHQYTAPDAGRIRTQCAEQRLDTVVTTEKDAVRAAPLTDCGVRVLVLRIEFTITGNGQGFFDRLYGIYSR